MLGGAIDDGGEQRPPGDRVRRGRRTTYRGRGLAKALSVGRVVDTRRQLSFTRTTSTEALQARTSCRNWDCAGTSNDRGAVSQSGRDARFTAAIVHSQPSQRWIVVTSAFHMPRSTGIFEKPDFHPIAYPVAFRTRGGWSEDLRLTFDPIRNLGSFEIIVHEWIGLPAYRVSGRSDYLFPGPATACERHYSPALRHLPLQCN